MIALDLTHMAGEHLDLTSEGPLMAGRPESARPFIGIRFACCEVYARIYRDREGTAYVGHCPRCLKRVELKVAPGGSVSRFFTAY